MGKLLALLDLFRKGNTVADPALWKHGGAALQAALAAVILSLNSVAKVFGHDLQISMEDAGAMATGVVALVGVLSTYLTSDKVGLPAKPEPGAGSVGNAAAPRDERAAAPVGSITADTERAAQVWARNQPHDETAGDLRGGP